jgi:hypothetical protein
VRVLFLLAFSLLLGANQSARAGTMEGKCLEQTRAGFDNKITAGWTLKCNKGTWATVGEGADTADANGYVEMYVDEGAASGARAVLQFRPRRSNECLIGIDDDGTRLSKAVASQGCDTAVKTPVTMSLGRRAGGWNMAAGVVRTSGKQQAFCAIYMPGQSLGIAGGREYYLVGVFIEAK